MDIIIIVDNILGKTLTSTKYINNNLIEVKIIIILTYNNYNYIKTIKFYIKIN